MIYWYSLFRKKMLLPLLVWKEALLPSSPAPASWWFWRTGVCGCLPLRPTCVWDLAQTAEMMSRNNQFQERNTKQHVMMSIHVYLQIIYCKRGSQKSFNLHVCVIMLVIYQFQQALGLLGNPARVVRDIRPDGFKQLVLIITLERRLTNQHLVHQHTKRPPVHGEGVLLSEEDLKWQI